MQKHALLGDVRGTGLMVGIEIVDGGPERRHAPAAAHWIRETMVRRRVLLSTDGPYANVIKIKPPMCFGAAEADRLVEELEQACPLAEECVGRGMKCAISLYLYKSQTIFVCSRQMGLATTRSKSCPGDVLWRGRSCVRGA